MKRAALALVLAAVAFLPACGAGAREDVPFCLEQSKNDGLLILFAQAVPTATYVPCLSGLPAGWSFAGALKPVTPSIAGLPSLGMWTSVGPP